MKKRNKIWNEKLSTIVMILAGIIMLIHAGVSVIPHNVKEFRAYENGNVVIGEIVGVTNRGQSVKTLMIEFVDENSDKQLIYRRGHGTLEEKRALIGTEVELLVYDDAGILLGDIHHHLRNL